MSPDFEAAVPRDMDIGHWHPREEDGGHSLLAPEDGGAGPTRGQAAQSQLLPRLDLMMEKHFKWMFLPVVEEVLLLYDLG